MKKNSTVYKNVKLGKGSIVEEFCVLGKPPRGKKENELALEVGEKALIRSFSTIYAGSKIGKSLQTGTGVVIREDNIIGNNVVVGSGTVLEVSNKIGNNVRIHSGCFMELAQIEDNVFIGPCVVLVDDLHPPCSRFKECVGGVKIKENAKIGANSTILPGVVIGKNALVGAGSVVTKNVPDNSVVVGNPARIVNKVENLKCIKGFYKSAYSVLI